MKIAIIIPVYNVTTFLEETLHSVIGQDYPHKEVIVVDDGSKTESTNEIARICSLFDHVTLLRQQHIGAAAARDKGLVHTQADYILFLDGDDLLLPGALKFFASELRKTPAATAIYGKTQFIDAHGNKIANRGIFAESGKAVLYNLLEKKFGFCNGSICIRREALEKISPNNHAMKHGEDWVLWCHLALSGNIVFGGEHFVLGYRQHNANVSNSFQNHFPLIIEAYEAVFSDPLFIDAVGDNTLQELRKKCLCRLHIQLAHNFSMNGKPEQAQYHWAQVDLPFSLFLEALPS